MYEYHIWTFNEKVPKNKIADELNILGIQGWKLVHIEPNIDNVGNSFYFIRKLKDPILLTETTEERNMSKHHRVTQ